MSAIYAVNFVFKNSNVQLALHFKAFKNADEAYKKATSVDVTGAQEFTDDFGCRGVVDLTEVVSVVFNDMDSEFKKNAEFRIRQEMEIQAQARLQASTASKLIKPVPPSANSAANA